MPKAPIRQPPPGAANVPRRPTNRAPWSVAEARAALHDAHSRGLNLNTYARAVGLEPRGLYWWRRRLADHSTGAALPPPTQPRRDASFVRVVVAQPPTPTDAGVVVRAGSVTVELKPGFCAETLARALAVLAQVGRPC